MLNRYRDQLIFAVTILACFIYVGLWGQDVQQICVDGGPATKNPDGSYTCERDHIKAPLTKKRDAQARSAQPQANTAGNLTHRIAISYEIDTRAPNPVHHYALLLDDQFTGGTFTNGHVGIKIDPKECYLYRVETDYKTVFSVPCTTGEIYLAPSWTREKAYQCAHAMMKSISSNEAKKHAKELIRVCAETPPLLHPN
jgi:hypothetical protein